MLAQEINQKIAKFKGLKSSPCNDKITTETGWIYVSDNERMLTYEKNWAESISDAWELFEEMPMAQIRRMSYENYFGYLCQLPLRLAEEQVSEYGKTAPFAICLAWITWREQMRKTCKKCGEEFDASNWPNLIKSILLKLSLCRNCVPKGEEVVLPLKSKKFHFL